MSISLRRAERADADTVAELLHAAFAEYREILVPPSGVQRESAASVLEKMQTGSWLIAECDRVAAGCVFYEARMDFMYLGRLAVLPHYRGRGIANALIAQVETLAYQGGLHHVRLGVRVALPALRATYERRGYRVIEYHTHQGFTEPTYVMLDKPLPVIPDLTV